MKILQCTRYTYFLHCCMLVVAGVFLNLPNSVNASTQYKCKDNTGAISYSDKKCNSEQKLVATMNNATSNRVYDLPDAMISPQELDGIWRDSTNANYNNSWLFNNGRVTFSNRQGVTMKERYSLQDDQIIFHHQGGLWGDGDWDEPVTIVQYTGETLVLRWGVAVVVLHRHSP